MDAGAIADNNRGVGLMGAFDFEAAQAAFEKALERRPGWADATVNRAIAILNQSVEGRQEDALAVLATVVQANPDHLRARYASGLCLIFVGRPDEALAHFARVAAADPRDAYAAYYHGQCLELAGDSAAALAEYRRAAQLDPYLRSALLGLQRTLQRAGDEPGAAAALADFQRLADNPRARLAEFKYTRMGAKGEAVAVPAQRAESVAVPAGPTCADAAPLLPSLPAGSAWNDAAAPRSITVADIDGDGRLDLFATAALRGSPPNAVLLQRPDDSFAAAPDHPLASVPGVRAALWGDVDNDGRTDVVLCSPAGTRLWTRLDSGWSDATARAVVLSGSPSTNGVLADLDHDGDLDILLVGGGHGGREAQLLINLDGAAFRDITAQAIPPTVRAAQAVVADFDGDRDLDLFLRGNGTPNLLLRNDRLWNWVPWTGDEEIAAVETVAAAAGDVDGDGAMDLVLLPRGRSPIAFAFPQRGDDGKVGATMLPELPLGATGFALADLDGQGRVWAFAPDDGDGRAAMLGGWALAALDALHGPSVVGVGEHGALVIRRPGPARHDFASLDFRGRVDPGQSMRSNASGIGTLVNARVGERWITRAALPSSSNPGQSLQPVQIGLGGAPMIDFAFIDWSDGVFQSELAISPGGPRTIVETQRQISSCPLLFAWDGHGHAFVSDLLGVGGLGYLVKPGEYAPPRPRERFLLPQGLPVPRAGRLEIVLHEPMEEAVYLDHAALLAVDLPPGWDVVLDERMGLADPEPTGEPIFFRDLRTPRRAVAEWVEHGARRGADATAAVAWADHEAAPIGPLDGRLIGRQCGEHTLLLEFDAPLVGAQGTRPVLIVDGWVEYPYCQTNFAAWQAEEPYDAPSLDARRRDGTWVTQLDRFGYPAGMPRCMAMPLPPLPGWCTALRLRTNQEIRWDRVGVAFAEPCPQARIVELPRRSAALRFTGFPQRREGAHRRPIYDYQRRSPLADMKMQRGMYTTFGDVAELLDRPDGALAIFGPGEEVALAFTAPSSPPPTRWTRRLMLDVRGWCKDMDLFTGDGETVEPVPGERDEAAQALHDRFNVRAGGGR